MNNRYIFILIFVMSAIIGRAQIGGNTSFNFLNIPGSARVAAMGGSYFAIKDGDIHLAQFNPSLLDSNMAGKLGMSYVDYYAGVNLGYATYARQFNKKVTGGATMQYSNYGKQDELDALGNSIGSFNAADYNLILGCGYQYDSLWSIGLNMKNIYSAFANYSSYALAFDGAVTYNKPSRNFTASMMVTNLGMQLKTYTSGVREKLPFEMMIGITKRPAHAPFRFSVVYSNMQHWNLTYTNPNEPVVTDPVTGEVIEVKKWEFGDQLMRHITFGSEFIFGPNFNLRVAYNYRRRQELMVSDKPGMAGFSLGLGFKVSKFQISYGRAIYHLAGASNHFSITTSLQQWMH